MSTQPKTIDDISRTKTALDGGERLAGRDADGDFKITATNLISLYAESWYSISETVAYSSADSPTFIATAEEDLTGILSIGMKIRISQTTTKYFIITAISYSDPTTTITLYGGTDYTLADETISTLEYSTARAPYGFPLDVDKWTVEITDSTDRTQSSPVSGTWYNIGSLSIDCPIGEWKLKTKINCRASYANNPTNVLTAISSSPSSLSDSDFQFFSSGYYYAHSYCYLNTTLSVLSKTTYYFLAKTTTGSTTSIDLFNATDQFSIKLECSYI